MSLDNNLFTLWMVPSEQSPGDIDCIDPQSSEVLYRKRRRNVVKGPDYFWSLLDPISDAMLASVTALGATSKTKTITLHDPDVPVQLTFSGTITFKWSFTWETHEFEWRKDSCYLVRKPDPPVQVAVTDPAKKGRPASVQVLDYNLRRFDIDDRKGLEIVMLCALLTFEDYTEGFRQPTTPPNVVPAPNGSGIRRGPSALALPTGAGPSVPPPPPPVPKIQLSLEPNEITVTEEGSVSEYAQHCANVLADKDMMFIVIKSSSPDVVQRVVQVAQETKRLRHRAYDDDDEELFQYLTYDQDKEANAPKKKPKRVIRLDDRPEPAPRADAAYKPLTTLTIHLSKIPIPELTPQGAPSQQRPTKSSPPPARQSRPSPSPSPRPNSSSQQQPSRLQKPSGHGRSSSAEPRPSAGQQRPSNSSSNSGNLNLSGGSARPRPVSSHGLNFMPPPERPAGGSSRPQSQYLGNAPPGMPRPVTPSYPAQPQPPPQQAQPQSQSILGKLFGRT